MLPLFFGLETEPLKAPTLFNVGPLSITNAMFFMVITAAATIAILYSAAKLSQLYPKSRFAYYVELLMDALWETALAMAIFTIGLVQFTAIRQLGIKKHLRHYFAAPLYNPMNLFIGLNEVFGELLRIVTLSMRLFGVIYAGEVLISAVGQIAGNFGWLATVPTVLLEIFFSIIQAYVFMMLSATYLSVAIGGSEDHKEHKEMEAAA
jgi:F0F1-type ATP synthase membrane subunit a